MEEYSHIFYMILYIIYTCDYIHHIYTLYTYVSCFTKVFQMLQKHSATKMQLQFSNPFFLSFLSPNFSSNPTPKSIPLVFLFRNGQASHGYWHSVKYQVIVELIISSWIKIEQGNPVWGIGFQKSAKSFRVTSTSSFTWQNVKEKQWNLLTPITIFFKTQISKGGWEEKTKE